MLNLKIHLNDKISANMKIINSEILEKGDIILTTTNEKLSDVIKKATNSDISHAMMYVARGSVMDSTSNGVHSKNIEKIFYEDNCSIYVLRLINPIDDFLKDNVIDFVRASTGTPYSMKEAALSAKEMKNSGGSEKMFCSRLIARAYSSVGIELHQNPNFCTPENLKNSTLLRQVENFSIEISEKEIEQIILAGDDTKGMSEVTNKLLAGVRKISPKILSVNDIIEVSVKFQKFDSKLADAYKDSGYLDYWKTQEEKYPWRYDISEMFELHDRLKNTARLNSLVRYCNDTLIDDENGVFEHWYRNAVTVASLYQRYPREVLKLELRLYKNLCDQHDRRMAVIEQWKKETGL